MLTHAKNTAKPHGVWCSTGGRTAISELWTEATCLDCLAAGRDEFEIGAVGRLEELGFDADAFDLPSTRSPETVEQWLDT